MAEITIDNVFYSLNELKKLLPDTQTVAEGELIVQTKSYIVNTGVSMETIARAINNELIGFVMKGKVTPSMIRVKLGENANYTAFYIKKSDISKFENAHILLEMVF